MVAVRACACKRAGVQALGVPMRAASVSAGFQGNTDLLAFQAEHQLLDKGPVNFVEKALAEGQVSRLCALLRWRLGRRAACASHVVMASRQASRLCEMAGALGKWQRSTMACGPLALPCAMADGLQEQLRSNAASRPAACAPYHVVHVMVHGSCGASEWFIWSRAVRRSRP